MNPERPWRLADFQFDLPPNLIAQHPAEKRDESRLMIVDRLSGNITHSRFSDLPNHLKTGDRLVRNVSTVAPVRLWARREGKSRLHEILLVDWSDPRRVSAMIKGGRRLKPGEWLDLVDPVGLAEGDQIRFLEANQKGQYLLDWESTNRMEEILQRLGRAPLPPYIRRNPNSDPQPDRERYQCIYAQPSPLAEGQSIAAPTAGLHFSPELENRLANAGIRWVSLRLDVGVGTFLPVRTENLEDHKMHKESYRIEEEAVEEITLARTQGHRIVCVGTTTVRALESSVRNGVLCPGHAETELFIQPGYPFSIPDALITNFHLPGSTLLMLVSAFAGYELIMRAYREAIREGYRFFSYGDAMLIL